MTDSDHGYAFDNAVAGQRDRLRALEAVFDPGTFRRLGECGVAPRWHCLEVGAGAGSVARWLAERVGSDGSVLATDLDLTTFGEPGHHQLTTQVHDLTRDPLPEGRFDLVHVRFVLAWLPDPATAVRRLVEALRPGGLLVAEDLDFVSAVPDPAMDPESAELLARVVHAHLAVVVDRSGFDPTHGRRLRSRLEDAGLVDVAAEGQATTWRDGEPGGELWRLTFAQLREPMVRAGLVGGPEVDRAVELCRSGLSYLSPLAVAAWGQRPERLDVSTS
jgi:SAM-dependent methyltransferase